MALDLEVPDHIVKLNQGHNLMIIKLQLDNILKVDNENKKQGGYMQTKQHHTKLILKNEKAKYLTTKHSFETSLKKGI